MKREKTITLGVGDWDELSSFIINHGNSPDNIKSLALVIRGKLDEN